MSLDLWHVSTWLRDAVYAVACKYEQMLAHPGSQLCKLLDTCPADTFCAARDKTVLVRQAESLCEERLIAHHT